MTTPDTTSSSQHGAEASDLTPQSTGLTPLGPDEPEAEFIARRSMELATVFKALGIDIGPYEAQAMIIQAFSVLITAGASQEAIAEYCLRVWDAIQAQIEAAKAQAFLGLPMASSAVN